MSTFDTDFAAAATESESSTASEGLETSTPSEAVTEGATTPSPEPESFDYSPHADKLVTVKVDGKDVPVPLKEALAGYQRQADYTRKTQGISARQQDLDAWDALKSAMNADPQGTILQLAQELGITLGEAAEIATTGAPADPLQQSVSSIEDRLKQLESERGQLQLQQEVGRLEAKYGDDFVANDVLQFAIDQKIGNLEHAFQVLYMPTLQARLAERDVGEKTAAEDAARVEAKRGASVVSGGHGVTPGSAPPQVDSFEAAWTLSGGTLD